MVSAASIYNRIKNVEISTQGSPLLVYTCAVLNFLLFGWGLVILGVSNGCTEDIIIGLLQFFLPVVGWIWSAIWGLLIILRKRDEVSKDRDAECENSGATLP